MEQVHEIKDRINDIVNKFASMYPVGVTIMIPSGNALNDMIADLIKDKCKNAIVLKGVISKITTEAVDELVMLPNSDFRKHYQDNFEDAYDELSGYLETMDKQRNGYFSRHFVKNDEMRQVLNKTMTTTQAAYARYAKLINNQNVLVVDDTITHGQTIEEACKIVADVYFPKTITVLTLMSRLYQD